MIEVVKNNLLMLRYIKKYCKGYITLTIINSILINFSSILNVLYLRFILEQLAGDTNLTNLIIISILLTFLNIFISYFGNWFGSCFIPINTRKLSKGMQNDMFGKTRMLDYECYEDFEFYNRLTFALEQSDTRAIGILNVVSTFIGSIFGVTGFSVLVTFFDPILLLVVILSVILSLSISFKTMKIQYSLYDKQISENRKAEYSKRVFYQYETAKELRLFQGLNDLISQHYNHSIDNVIDIIKKYVFKINKLNKINTLFSNVITLVNNMYLIIRVVNKSIMIADFVALNSSVSQLTTSILNMLNIIPSTKENSMYVNDFKYFINYPSKIEKNEDVTEELREYEIEFENVWFKYPSSSKYVLKNIECSFKSGEKIAFVGRNGSGKSTMIKLMTRLYDPTKGMIRVNKINLFDYNLSNIRKGIGIIFQDFQIYSITIIENILMRPVIDREYDEKLAWDALEKVGLKAKVEKFENQLYTNLLREYNSDGAIFSGGEFQSLAIARIFANDCKLIILDEPSSALDSITEKKIFDQVLSIFFDKTIILITHKLQNVMHVNHIVFFENGEIKEEGSHGDLLQLNLGYAQMYKTQYETYDDNFDIIHG